MRGQIIKRGDGRYLVRAPRGRKANGSRLYHSKTIYGSKRDAQSYLMKVLREVELGTFVERSKESLADYLKRWLNDVAAKNVRRRTLEDYRGLADRHLIPHLGDYSLAQLSTESIEKVYTGLGARGLSPRTIRYAHSVLHNALTHAVNRGHLSRNPAHGVTLPRERRREMRSLTKAEAVRFLEAARDTRFEPLWNVLLSGGIRPAEALGLKWCDLQGDRIQIQRSLVRLRDHSYEFEAPKTAKARRSVPLPQTALTLLKTHRASQAAERLAAGAEWNALDLVFCTQTGAPLEWRRIVRAYFRPVMKAAEIGTLRPYDLRHTCATLLLCEGENAKVISERLGHASVALTLEVYSHVLPDMQQRAAETLESVLYAAR